MNGTTSCPYCETRFKVNEVQMSLHQGMVRCGHCLQAFDARPNFLPEASLEANPQLSLPMGEIPPTSAAEPVTADTPEVALSAGIPAEIPAEIPMEIVAPPATIEPPVDGADSSHNAQTAPESATTIDATPDSVTPLTESPLPMEAAVESSEPSPEIAHTPADEPDFLQPEHSLATMRRWPWISGLLVLVLLLVAQLLYGYRIMLAARVPALKPALAGYCQLLACQIPLPRHSERMSIESSGLDADSAQPERITLSALIRNRADYTQAYPTLALTLNDDQDRPLARRLFPPKEYLLAPAQVASGLTAGQEVNIKLALQSREMKASGYRLELFYSPD